MRHESAGVGGERPVPPSSDDMASSMVLLERMRGGEHAARDELIRRYWPRLERWARGRLPASARDLYETVDVVQETLIAALRRLRGPRGGRHRLTTRLPANGCSESYSHAREAVPPSRRTNRPRQRTLGSRTVPAGPAHRSRCSRALRARVFAFGHRGSGGGPFEGRARSSLRRDHARAGETLGHIDADGGLPRSISPRERDGSP